MVDCNASEGKQQGLLHFFNQTPQLPFFLLLISVQLLFEGSLNLLGKQQTSMTAGGIYFTQSFQLCSYYLRVAMQHLFEGGIYSRAVSIRRRCLFEDGVCSKKYS